MLAAGLRLAGPLSIALCACTPGRPMLTLDFELSGDSPPASLSSRIDSLGVGQHELVRRWEGPSKPMKCAVVFRDDLTDDQVAAVVACFEPPGRLELLPVATREDGADAGYDLAAEAARVDAWLEANPGADLATYNGLDADAGGSAALLWFRHERGGELVACVRPSRLPQVDWRFTSDDVAAAEPAVDSLGYPAVDVELLPSRRAAFEAFTGALEGRQLAVVLDGRLLRAPTVESPLTAGVLVRGDWTEGEARQVARAIEAPLDVSVRFVGRR